MLEVTAEQKTDRIYELFRSYQTVKETLASIKEGAAVVTIHTPEGYTDLDNIFSSGAYIERLRGDLMMQLLNKRNELIEALEKEKKAELGYTDDDNDWKEPFPIGTPKNDHRRTLTDNDDGK